MVVVHGGFLALAAVFAAAAVGKIVDPRPMTEFLNTLRVPSATTAVVALILVDIVIALGLAFTTSWLPLGGSVAVTTLGAIGVIIIRNRGLEVGCGCFGDSGESAGDTLLRNGLIAAISLVLLVPGPHLASLAGGVLAVAAGGCAIMLRSVGIHHARH